MLTISEFLYKITPKDKHHNLIYKARFWKHLWQRMTRGFDDGDTWSLDYTIIKFTLPRLKRYRQIMTTGCSIPSKIYNEVKETYVKDGCTLNEYDAFENNKVRELFEKECKIKWLIILDKMIEGFESYVEEDKSQDLDHEVRVLNQMLKLKNKESKKIVKKFNDIGYIKIKDIDIDMLRDLKIHEALELFHEYFCSLWW